MPRSLTANEQAVLAHVVPDPNAWWTRASASLADAAEGALAAKIARWQADYDAAAAAGNYRNRAQRDADAAPAPKIPTYRELRARAYTAQLSGGSTTPLEALGDTLDVVIKELRALRAAVGGAANAEFEAKAAAIDAIKAQFPKP